MLTTTSSLERYTQEQRIQIYSFLFWNDYHSAIAIFHALLRFYNYNNRPSVLVIRRIVQDSELTFLLHNVQMPKRQGTVRSSASSIAVVRACVAEDRNLTFASELKPGLPTQQTTNKIKASSIKVCLVNFHFH